MNEQKVPQRLVEQRLRNRIMEALLGLAEWRTDLPSWGATEYFESFFDFFPYVGDLVANATLTEAERAVLSEVHELMKAALGDTPRDVTTDQLIASGWCARVEPVAHHALSVMLRRGRFSEEHEEEAPSSPVRWPP